jgi:hypothetical protein
MTTANEPEKSESGVYVDTKTNKVVESVPEEGVQLVAPGGTIDDEAKRNIEAHKAVEDYPPQSEPVQVETASDDSDVETADDKTVTTKSVKR